MPFCVILYKLSIIINKNTFDKNYKEISLSKYFIGYKYLNCLKISQQDFNSDIICFLRFCYNKYYRSNK